MTGDGGVQQRGVEHGAAERSGLVEGGRERDQPVTRHRAVGRLVADDAGDGRGLADRAAGVGANRQRGLVGGDGCAGATAGAAGDPAQVPRVVGREVGRVLGGRAHRELVHVGLAEHDDAGRLDPAADRRVPRRYPALQDLRAGGGRDAFGDYDVLHGQRNAGQRTQFLAVGPAPVHRSGGRERALAVDVQERLDVGVHRLDPVEVGLRDLHGADLARGDQGAEVGRRSPDHAVRSAVGQPIPRAHDSSARICGTRNLSSSTAGAPASTDSRGSDGRTTSSR